MTTLTTEQFNLLTRIKELAVEAVRSGVELNNCMFAVQMGYNEGIQSLSRARTPRSASGCRRRSDSRSHTRRDAGSIPSAGESRSISRSGGRSSTPSRTRRDAGSNPSAGDSRSISRSGGRSSTPSRTRCGAGSNPSAGDSRSMSKGGRRSSTPSRTRRGAGPNPSAGVSRSIEERALHFIESVIEGLNQKRDGERKTWDEAVNYLNRNGKESRFTRWAYVKKDAKILQKTEKLQLSDSLRQVILSVNDGTTPLEWLHVLKAFSLVELAGEPVEIGETSQLTRHPEDAVRQGSACDVLQECETNRRD